jgi:hypothetical protein
MDSLYRRIVLPPIAALLLASVGCQKATGPGNSSSPEQQQNQKGLRQIAVETLGLKLEGKVTQEQKENFLGLRTDNIMFTRRLDSRTFFAYDKRFSNTSETGSYNEPDEAFLKRNHELLERLRIPAAEIESEKIVQEKTQVGQRDAKTGELKLEPIVAGKKWAWTTRAIDGLPVFSSRATIGLRPNGEIGFLEVHWPEVPAKVIAEARRYRELANGNWHAPELAGARVESVTAGILHSPAAATALDIVPVIRIIYAPLDAHIGKKPVAYVDPEGTPVAMPRVFMQPPHEEQKPERTPPKQ